MLDHFVFIHISKICYANNCGDDDASINGYNGILVAGCVSVCCVHSLRTQSSSIIEQERVGAPFPFKYPRAWHLRHFPTETWEVRFEFPHTAEGIGPMHLIQC